MLIPSLVRPSTLKEKRAKLSTFSSSRLCLMRSASLFNVSRGSGKVPFPYLIPILEVLFSDSKEPEVLWNFSHFEHGKRLTLAQNPHFYDKELPPRGKACGDTFSTLPVERFRGQIYVLKKSDRRVYLDCCPQRRTFDNVWIVNRILIFRGPSPPSIFYPN